MSWHPETNGNSVTTWIPLAEPFTPASNCGNYFRSHEYRLVAWDPIYGRLDKRGVGCFPEPVTESAVLAGQKKGPLYSFAPFRCPGSWSTMSTTKVNPSILDVICCPPGYTLDDSKQGIRHGRGCSSTALSGFVFTYATSGFPVRMSTNYVSTSTLKEVVVFEASNLRGRTTVDAHSTPASVAASSTPVVDASPPDISSEIPDPPISDAPITAAPSRSFGILEPTSVPSLYIISTILGGTSSGSDTLKGTKFLSETSLTHVSETTDMIASDVARDSAENLSKEAILGIGLGAALGLVVIAGLALALLLRNGMKKWLPPVFNKEKSTTERMELSAEPLRYEMPG